MDSASEFDRDVVAWDAAEEVAAANAASGVGCIEVEDHIGRTETNLSVGMSCAVVKDLGD